MTEPAAPAAPASAEFRGRVAWVVGASGTIGSAVAAALVDAGAIVVASSRRAASIERRTAADGGGRLVPLVLDVRDRSAVDAAAARIVELEGRLDLLVNSTSIDLFGAFDALDDADWAKVYDSKLFAYVRTIRAALPTMIRQRYGRIVNVSGRGGHQPTSPSHLPGMSANAAVNLLTKGLAASHARDGIRVNAVAPGPVASPRFDAIAEANWRVAGGAASGAASPPSSIAGASPVRPEDVAQVVLFLLSDRSHLLSGTVLQADGGSTASL